MDFTRLRLSGFKSFVEAAELRIEPGLTGVVGPNGCGKSNLLEALRWVMGAASAKAMRGEGMDDVIFAGSTSRLSRNHAEVALTIDNSAGDAPSPFRADPWLEVTRRIDRGEGSTFRVNGREVRARDVQILFADASTGANSPALVRQGQISELIAARPQNRRRILEEAAGITGLHGRRHEAELKVAAATANLDRLDDLAGELASGLGRLQREARQAARYKALAAEIRELHARLLQGRWAEALRTARNLARQARDAEGVLTTATAKAAEAVTRATEAVAAIRPLQEEEIVAAAVLSRLAIERDRVERDLEQAAAESKRLAAEIERLDDDDRREALRLDDAGGAEVRLAAELERLRAQAQQSPERGPALEAAARTAEAARAKAEADVESLSAKAAASEAEARAARSRLDDAEQRQARARAALESALAGLATLGEAPVTAGAVDRLGEAERALDAARRSLEVTEAARAVALEREAAARTVARESEDALAERSTEARALARLAQHSRRGDFPSALEQVTAEPGLEAALAAALGDELEAALDPRASAHWAGAKAQGPVWPKGATPLAPLIGAPGALAARLAFTALVGAAQGERLRALIPPGARLVSREGDLWRWDGYTVRAGAPRPTQVRLEQKVRLADLEAEIARLGPAAAASKAAQAGAAAAVAETEQALAAARAVLREAETELAAARAAGEAARDEAARHGARLAALTEARIRSESEVAESESEVGVRAAEAAGRAVDPALAGRLEAARQTQAAARSAAAEARLAVEADRRENQAIAERIAQATVEIEQWRGRAAEARSRRDEIAVARTRASEALAAAGLAPARIEARKAALLDELAAAEGRRDRAADALATGEAARAEADRAARAAGAAAADARESRATLAARREAADERLGEHARALADAAGLAPDVLERRYGGQADEPGEGSDAAADEARLARLERERDAMGPVNLRAEEEAAEQAERVRVLAAERADLGAALTKLRQAVTELNAEGRERLLEAFEVIHGHFRDLFVTLFQGGQAELRLVESHDPLEAGLEILACPPGKRMATMSLMSGGEQALTAMALIFAVFLSNPAPLCVLDEADAPLDDANVERFCNLLAAMRSRTRTRFMVITHNALTMSRMDRLYGVTMREAGVSQLVSVDLRQAEAIAAN